MFCNLGLPDYNSTFTLVIKVIKIQGFIINPYLFQMYFQSGFTFSKVFFVSRIRNELQKGTFAIKSKQTKKRKKYGLLDKLYNE